MRILALSLHPSYTVTDMRNESEKTMIKYNLDCIIFWLNFWFKTRIIKNWVDTNRFEIICYKYIPVYEHIRYTDITNSTDKLCSVHCVQIPSICILYIMTIAANFKAERVHFRCYNEFRVVFTQAKGKTCFRRLK